MRSVSASDPHRDAQMATALLSAAEAADLVVLAGYLATRHEGLDRLLPLADRMVPVPVITETLEMLHVATEATVLRGQVVERGDLAVAGLGRGIPPLPEAPFWDLTENEAAAALDGIGRADILVTHARPKGVADRFGGRSVGSPAIRAAVARLRPSGHVLGHVHDGRGQRGRIGTTLRLNPGPAPAGLEWT